MENSPFKNLKVWMLTDGKAGHHHQSLCIAETLGVVPEIHAFERRPLSLLWELISPQLGVKNPPMGENGWPDMVIATSYHMAAVSQYIKQQSPKTFCVQVMARRHMPWCDAVLGFSHDKPKKADNILILETAPHMVTPENLAKGAAEWREKLKNHPSPKTTVIVGGDCRHLTLTNEKAEKLADDLVAHAQKTGGSLWVTTSRRTGPEQKKLIEDKLAAAASAGTSVFVWNGEGANPYYGFMALADEIVVTADSFSMVTESCAAGKPVFVYGLNEWGVKKFDALYRHLQKKGYLAAFGDAAFKAPKEPLNERPKIKAFVEARYAAFKGK